MVVCVSYPLLGVIRRQRAVMLQLNTLLTSQAMGRVSRGSIISSMPKTLAVRMGSRTLSNFARSSFIIFSLAAAVGALSSCRLYAASIPPSNGRLPQSAEGLCIHR